MSLYRDNGNRILKIMGNPRFVVGRCTGVLIGYSNNGQAIALERCRDVR